MKLQIVAALTLLWIIVMDQGAVALPEQAPSGSTPLTSKTVPLPNDIFPDSLSRLPLLKREELDDEGKKAYDSALANIASDRSTGLQGNSGFRLYSPRLAEYQGRVSQYLRYETNLDRRLTELAILVAARELDSQYQWTNHETIAVKEGLEQKIIDVVKFRKATAGLGQKEAIIIRFGRELFQKRELTSDTYAEAVKSFGNRGVVDLSALMGNYAMSAIMLNAVDQQLRPGQEPLLPIP